MPKIEQDILVRIKNIVEGLGDVQALALTVRSLGKTGGVPGLQGITRDAKSLGTQSRITTGDVSGLAVGLGRLNERAQKGGLGVFIKDLSVAANQLKQFQSFEKLDPFQSAKNLSLGSTAKALAADEVRRNSLNVPSTALSAGLAKRDPFQTAQNLRLGAAAKELALFNTEAKKTNGILSGLSFGTKDVTKSFLGMTVSGSGASAVFLSIASAAALLVAVLAAVGVGLAALGFSQFVQEGIRFNKVIESAKIGIATLVANTYDVKDAAGQLLSPIDSFNASLEKSDELERALQKSAIETKFEFEEILGFFNSTVIASAGLKTNLTDLVALTQDFALAAGAANIDVTNTNTGIKQLLTGTTTVRNQLARVIFPGQGTKEINEQLKKYREAGTLVEFLTGKLAVFRLSADQVSQSFEAVGSNVLDTFKVFAALSTLPLFNKIKETLGFVIKQVVDLSGETVKLTPTFQKIADLLGAILSFLGDRMQEAVIAIFDGIRSWADWLYANREVLGEILVACYAIAEQVGGIIYDGLVQTNGELLSANNNTKNWSSALSGVAIFVGFIRDLISAIVLAIEIVIGLILRGIGGALQFVGGIVDSLIEKLGLAGKLIAGITGSNLSGIGNALTNSGQNLTDAGLDRFIDLANGGHTGDALNRLSDTASILKNTKKSTPFSFTPRNTGGVGGGESGKAKAERAAKERINVLRKLFEAANDLQLAFADKELAISQATNSLLIEGLQYSYEQGLISAEAFYKQKQALEEKDLKLEERNLRARKEVNLVKLENEVAAIFGKKGFTQDEFSALLERFRTADDTAGSTESTSFNKALTAYLKNRADEVKIDEQLAQIGIKRQKIEKDVTKETEQQAKANARFFDSIAGEFAALQGNDGVKALTDLQHRIADELPKALSEFGKEVPGIQVVIDSLKNLAGVDISFINNQLAEQGIALESLPDPIRVLLKLYEALNGAAKLTAIQSSVVKARNAFEFATGNTDTDFNAGRISATTASQQIDTAQKALTDALTAAYREQLQVVTELQSKGGIVSQDQIQNLEIARRAMQALTDATTAQKLAIDATQAQRDQDRFDLKRTDIENRQRAGQINSAQAQRELNALQQERIAGYEAELARLAQLDQTNLEVIKKTAEAHNNLNALVNETNEDALNLASQINGVVGNAFSSFIDSIQSGTESIGESFRKLLSSLLLGIANAIAQALLLRYVLKPLGLTGGDTGGFGGFFGKIFGGGKAEGGIISGAGTGVSDSAGLFALSHGEAVLPANSVRQYGRNMIQSIIGGTFIPQMSFRGLASGAIIGGGASGGRGGNTRIINSVDPNLVSDFLTSSEGEQIILNIIGKNPGVVQRVVS